MHNLIVGWIQDRFTAFENSCIYVVNLLLCVSWTCLICPHERALLNFNPQHPPPLLLPPHPLLSHHNYFQIPAEFIIPYRKPIWTAHFIRSPVITAINTNPYITTMEAALPPYKNSLHTLQTRNVLSHFNYPVPGDGEWNFFTLTSP